MSRLRLKLRNRIAVPAVAGNAAVADWLARTGLALGQDTVDRLDALAGTLQASTVWAKLDVLRLGVFPHAEASFENLRSGSWRARPVNGPIHLPWRGWLGNTGRNAWLDTGYPLDGSAQYRRDDCFYGVWVSTAGLNEHTGKVAGRDGGGGAGMGIQPYDAGRLAVVANNSVGRPNYRVGKSDGWSWFSRVPSAPGFVRIGRATRSRLRDTPSTGLPGGTVALLSDGAGNHPSAATVLAEAAGAGLDEAEAKILHDALATLFLALEAIDGTDEPEADGELPNYMTRAMGAALPFDVIHRGTLSSNSITEANFDLFPLTALYGGRELMAGSWSGAKAVLIWDNRADGGPLNATRANGLRDDGRWTTSAGNECRARYSTIARAMAATRARIAFHAGHDSGVVEGILSDAGFDPGTDVLYSDDITAGGQALIDATFTLLTASRGSQSRGENVVFYACTLDKVFLPGWRLGDALGGGEKRIIFDYESHDGRSGAEAIAHVAACRTLCQSAPGGPIRLAAFLSQPDNPRNAESGVDLDSAWQLHPLLDAWYLGVNASATETAIEQLNRRIDVLRGPAGDRPIDYARLAVAFQFGVAPNTTTIQDAIDTHDFVMGTRGRRAGDATTRMFGVWCWPNGADFGGDISRDTVKKQWKLFRGDIPYGQSVGDPAAATVSFIVDFERTDQITFGTGSAIASIAEDVRGTLLEQATGASQPTLGTMSNGRQAAVFSGGQWLRFTGQAPGLAWLTTGCIVGVVRELDPAVRAGGAATYVMMAYGANSATTQRQMNQRSDSSNHVFPRVACQTISSAGIVDRSDDPHWALYYFNTDNNTIYVEDDAGNASVPSGVTINTTTTSVNVTVGAVASLTPGSFFKGKINYIEVIPFTTDTDTVAQFRARLAQRTAS